MAATSGFVLLLFTATVAGEIQRHSPLQCESLRNAQTGRVSCSPIRCKNNVEPTCDFAPSPPLDLDPRWFKIGGVAYTMAKFNMSMCAIGMAEEFKGQVAFNCLWPRTAIATAAIEMLAGDLGVKASRSVDIMADAAHWILTQPVAECSGNTFIDDVIMTEKLGLSEADLDKYRMSSVVPLMPDFYVGDPADLERYVEGARKMQGIVGAFSAKFGGRG